MKNFIYTLIICSSLFACKNNTEEGGEAAPIEEKERKVTARDISINKENSYNDLFLDSMVVADYLQKNEFDEKVERRILSFYNSRNYQFAWFASDGMTEQARGFWNLYSYDVSHGNDSLQVDKKLDRKMDNLLAAENLVIKEGDKDFINTELTLTKYLVEHTLKVYEDGYVKRKEMERFVPSKKVDALVVADSLLKKKHKDDKYYEDVNENYKSLKGQLQKYYDIATKGGWPVIPAEKKSYKKGIASPVIATIKRRLSISGDLAVSDTTPVFNDTLENAVKEFQVRHGYTPTGVINAAIVKEMNVTAVQKVQQILINMDRMRWMPNQEKGNYILVNIPEFVLHVFEGGKKAFDMNVVVGKEGHSTVMFTGDLNQVVFSPYWNIPESIVKNEILPAISRDGSYLERNNMEITNEGEIPEIRQKPGGKNSLGKVKFLFPNSFNIYFHDTPAKSLFNQDKRAYSHGCIRLSDPAKMAAYLLRNDANWNPQTISDAMNAGEEKNVRLKKAVPVFITYYTAWVSEDGKMNFREDIYSHDVALAKKVFTNTL